MKSFILLFSLIPIFSVQQDSTIKNFPNGVPCSSNTSTAWVNIALLIDTSAIMGNQRLRQLGLSLTSELSKYTISNISTPFTSRVGIMTYDSEYKIHGNFSTLNNYSDIANILLGLKASNISSAYGLEKALAMSIVWVDDVMPDETFRETIIIIFAASLEGVNINQLEMMGVMDEAQNLVTVNFNTSNANMTKVFETISTSSWNFTIDDTKLYGKIEWAISQTNCFCEGDQLYGIDPHTNRYTFYADCYLISEWFGFDDNQTFTQLCPDGSGMLPLAINNKFKNDFVLSDSEYFDDDGFNRMFYTGLHANKNNDWVWFDYDGTELPQNFTNWAPGDNNTGECAIAKSADYMKPWYWYEVSCFPTKENVTRAACQSLACDAGRRFPCAGLNPEKTILNKKKLSRKYKPK